MVLEPWYLSWNLKWVFLYPPVTSPLSSPYCSELIILVRPMTHLLSWIPHSHLRFWFLRKSSQVHAPLLSNLTVSFLSTLREPEPYVRLPSGMCKTITQDTTHPLFLLSWHWSSEPGHVDLLPATNDSVNSVSVKRLSWRKVLPPPWRDPTTVFETLVLPQNRLRKSIVSERVSVCST